MSYGAGEGEGEGVGKSYPTSDNIDRIGIGIGMWFNTYRSKTHTHVRPIPINDTSSYNSGHDPAFNMHACLHTDHSIPSFFTTWTFLVRVFSIDLLLVLNHFLYYKNFIESIILT